MSFILTALRGFSHFLIFKFLDSRREEDRSGQNGSKYYRTQSAINFLMNQVFVCYYRSQVSELCNILKGSIRSLYATILQHFERIYFAVHFVDETSLYCGLFAPCKNG
jgi:hypothetical protein